MHDLPRTAVARLVPIALAGLLVALAMIPLARPASRAADVDRFDAGERATVVTPVGAEATAALTGRAGPLWRAIGLADPGRVSVALVEDRFHERRFHELTARDAGGRPIAVLRLDAATGRLASAVRLDFRAGLADGATDGPMALAEARRTLARLELGEPGVAPELRQAMNGALWVVRWPRVVDGVPIERDGTTVRIWRSGRFHSATVSERPLAAMARRVSTAEARRLLKALLPRLLAADALTDARVAGLELRWVAPNDMFAPEKADAPAPLLRLAWVAEIRFTGATGERLRALAAWIDAEDGSLLGGDAIR